MDYSRLCINVSAHNNDDFSDLRLALRACISIVFCAFKNQLRLLVPEPIHVQHLVREFFQLSLNVFRRASPERLQFPLTNQYTIINHGSFEAGFRVEDTRRRLPRRDGDH